MKPWDAYALAASKAFRRRADRFDAADYLMTRYDRRLSRAKFSFDHVQVGATNATRGNAYEHLIERWLRPRDLNELQRVRFDGGGGL
jgi:hypothetical protein